MPNVRRTLEGIGAQANPARFDTDPIWSSCVLASSRGRCGRERSLRSYPHAAASTSYRPGATSVTRLKMSGLSRCNSNALTEVDAVNRSPACLLPEKIVAPKSALLTRLPANTHEPQIDVVRSSAGRLDRAGVRLMHPGARRGASRARDSRQWLRRRRERRREEQHFHSLATGEPRGTGRAHAGDAIGRRADRRTKGWVR